MNGNGPWSSKMCLSTSQARSTMGPHSNRLPKTDWNYMTSSSKILRSKEGTAKQPSAVTQYSFLILLSTASSLTSSSSSSNNPIFHQFPPVCPTSAGLRVKRTGSGTTAGTWPAEAKATASTSHGQVCATGGRNNDWLLPLWICWKRMAKTDAFMACCLHVAYIVLHHVWLRNRIRLLIVVQCHWLRETWPACILAIP